MQNSLLKFFLKIEGVNGVLKQKLCQRANPVPRVHVTLAQLLV